MKDGKCSGAMGNIIFYGTPAYGHINPTLHIVSELVNRGYFVIYYATEEFRQKIEDCGGEFRAYEFGDIEWSQKMGSRILKLSEIVLRFTCEQGERFLREAMELAPVLVFHDTLAFWGGMVAEILKVKAISVNSIVVVYGYTWKTFRMYLGEFGWESLSEFLELPDVFKYRRKLLKQYGVKINNLLELLMREEELNVFTYPCKMHPEGLRLKKNCFFLGATSNLRVDNCDLAEDYLYDNLIYVSLGTIFNDSLSFYEAVFKAFGDSKYHVVISCSGQYEKLKGMQRPSNVVLKSYVNQQKILKKCKVFISAGGMNSLCEAAANGVPCLLYPQQGEQRINAKMFEKLKLGKIVKREEELLRECEKLLETFKPDDILRDDFSQIFMNELMDKIEGMLMLI